MVLVDQPVVVVVLVVHRTVVDVVVRPIRVAHPWEKRACGAQRGPPLKLIVAIQIHPVTALIDLLIDIRNRRDTGHRVVA